MSIRRSHRRRDEGLANLAARLNAVAAQRGCTKLVHIYVGAPRPYETPGCTACAELQRRYDEAAPRPTPKRSSAAPIDDVEEP